MHYYVHKKSIGFIRIMRGQYITKLVEYSMEFLKAFFKEYSSNSVPYFNKKAGKLVISGFPFLLL